MLLQVLPRLFYFGGTFIHSCPKGYEIPKEDLKVIEDLQKKYNGNFFIENDLNFQ